jgi:hypothetical protein
LTEAPGVCVRLHDISSMSVTLIYGSK